MGGGGGIGTFGGGSVGGVSNPALGQPAVAGGGASAPPINPMQLPAGSAGPMMGMNAPTPTQGPSGLSQFATKFGRTMNNLTPLINALPGRQGQGQPGQGQQARGAPSIPMANQPYIPPPQMQNNPFAMSNAFYGG